MTETYTPPAPTTSATFDSLRRVLLVVWTVFAFGAGAFVAVLGTNAPYADEWEFVPALLGKEPALPWLWQQHNEHRLPLPRAVYLVLFKLTHDFRAGMWLQVAMLAALALFLMRFADRLRGRPHWADAFFPVSLLHVGHWENFIMGYQICFVLFTVLATGLVVLALWMTRENAARLGLLAGVLLVLLALTGGSGLVVVPPVAGWLVCVGVSVWRSGQKRRAVLILMLALLPLGYFGAYSVGYQRPAHHPEPCTDPVAVARVAGEVLALSLGVGLSGVWLPVSLGILVVGIATVGVLLRWWKEPDRRLSVVGLLAVAAGVTGVAVAIGVGRANFPNGEIMGLWARYSLLTWPLLAAAYLVWVKSGPLCSSQPVAGEAGLHGGSKWIPIALCVAAALVFPTNTGTGLLAGAEEKSQYSVMEADAAHGLSAEQIVEKDFPDSAQAPQEERALRAIPMLRAAGIGIFAGKQR